jgi:hypothetical protein
MIDWELIRENISAGRKLITTPPFKSGLQQNYQNIRILLVKR